MALPMPYFDQADHLRAQATDPMPSLADTAIVLPRDFIPDLHFNVWSGIPKLDGHELGLNSGVSASSVQLSRSIFNFNRV